MSASELFSVVVARELEVAETDTCAATMSSLSAGRGTITRWRTHDRTRVLRATRGQWQRGFTLLEVVVALAILALGLGVLLHAQASSLAAAGRTRGLTLAALLARSKMVDIERRLYDEGFTLGDSEDSGDFADEGQPDMKWSYRIMEIELNVDALQKSSGDSGENGQSGAEDISSASAALGLPLDTLTKQMSDSIRAVDLTISWPAGKYSETMHLRALLTREAAGGVTEAGTSAGTGSAGGVTK